MRPTWRNCLIISCALASFACGLGCDDDRSIHTYQTNKDTSPPANALGGGMSGPMASAGQPGPGGDGASPQSMDMSWDLPPGWKMLPPPTDPQARAMEVARIAVAENAPDAILTIVPLGGEGGDLLPNVARWQGQLKLPVATTPQDVINVTKLLDTPLGQVPVVDLSSPPGAAKPQRIVAAAIPLANNYTCFITLRGPIDVIGKERAHFDAFVRSVKFSPTGTDSAASSNTANRQPGAAPAPAGSADAGGIATYQAPSDWKPAKANNGMRVLGFADGPALITVDRLPAGGMNNPMALVNMWRGQVDLPALSNDQPVKPDEVVTIDGHLGMLFDMQGKGDKTKRVIVAMSTIGNDDWFFKLIGPADAVAGQRSAFLAFLQSVHFAGGASGAGGGNGGG